MTATRASCWGLSLVISLAGVLPGRAAPDWVERLTVWATPELRDIDARQLVIKGELAGLPAPAGTNSGIRRGFQTGRAMEGEDLWVELALENAVTADCVVLVPLLAKGAKGQVPGYGFPRRFQLEAIDEDGVVYLLLDETGDDFPNPGLYPVSAECPPGVGIKRIRLTATDPWQQGGPPVLALAEMLVLQGMIDRDEWIAGTDPTDPFSRLRAWIETGDAETKAIHWTAVAGKTYRIFASSTLDSTFRRTGRKRPRKSLPRQHDR